MKTRCYSLLALLLAMGSLVPTVRSAPAGGQPLTVAIFDFESKDEAVRDLGPKVAVLINASLSAEAQIITVERAELEKTLGEQELGLSGNSLRLGGVASLNALASCDSRSNIDLPRAPVFS